MAPQSGTRQRVAAARQRVRYYGGYVLRGSNWTNPTSTTLFVFTCMTSAVLLACLVLVAFFKWRRPTGAKAGARTGIYFIATLAMLCGFILRLTDTGLREETTSVTRYYSLLIVFQSLLFRIAELFIIAVIFRTVYVFSLPSVALSYQPSNVVQKPIFSKAIQVLQYVAITILGLLTFVAWVLLTTAYVYAIVRYPGSRFEYERLRESTKVGTAYQVIYFVCSITLLAATIISLGKSGASSKAKLLLLITTVALFIQSFFNLIDQIVLGYSKSFSSNLVNFDYATSYFYVFTTAAIFLALALYACISPSHDEAGTTHPAGVAPVGSTATATAAATATPSQPAMVQQPVAPGAGYQHSPGVPAANFSRGKPKYWYGRPPAAAVAT